MGIANASDVSIGSDPSDIYCPGAGKPAMKQVTNTHNRPEPKCDLRREDSLRCNWIRHYLFGRNIHRATKYHVQGSEVCLHLLLTVTINNLSNTADESILRAVETSAISMDFGKKTV
jgi:hypothetical protein